MFSSSRDSDYFVFDQTLLIMSEENPKIFSEMISH